MGRTLPGIPNRDYALPEIRDRPCSGAAVSRPFGDNAGVHPSEGTEYGKDQPIGLLPSICNRQSAQRPRPMARRHTDTVGRNMVVMRRIDPRMLKLLGVRFLLTDARMGGAEIRMRMQIPTTPREDRVRL